LRQAQVEWLRGKPGVQRDHGTEVDHLGGHECLDQGRRLRIPRQPFAESGSSESGQKETDCKPCGVARGRACAFVVHAVNRKTQRDDQDIAGHGGYKQFAIGQEMSFTEDAEA